MRLGITIVSPQAANERMQHGHRGLMASEIAIDEGENHIYFMEGRNRFAALRDLGYRVVKVWAHRDDSDELRRKYAP